MAIERTYTIPLRKEWQKAPRYRRAKKAVNAVKAFLIKHMKADEKNVKIGKYLNKEIWKHGMKNPPTKIRINVKKDDKGIVKAELVGAPEEKKEVKGKKAPKKEAKAVKKEEAKPTEKTEKKPTEKVEEKKEEPKQAEQKSAKQEPKKEAKPKPKSAKKKEPKPEKTPSEKP
jgi:large subunit ribosomal protein L31e